MKKGGEGKQTILKTAGLLFDPGERKEDLPNRVEGFSARINYIVEASIKGEKS